VARRAATPVPLVPLDLNARHAPWVSALAEEANHAVLGTFGAMASSSRSSSSSPGALATSGSALTLQRHRGMHHLRARPCKRTGRSANVRAVLTSLLPGLRELRVPLAVGYLWSSRHGSSSTTALRMTFNPAYADRGDSMVRVAHTRQRERHDGGEAGKDQQLGRLRVLLKCVWNELRTY
jgi:hypothetical protein